MVVFIDLTVALFACIGVVYTCLDLWAYLRRKSKKANAVLFLKLSNDRCEAVDTLLSIAKFYNATRAERYIEKIVICDFPESFVQEKEVLKKVLNLPLEFEEKN